VAVDIQTIQWFSSQLPLQEQKVGGVYNMGGPDRVSQHDVAQAVFEHFGHAQLPPTEKGGHHDATASRAESVGHCLK